MEFAVKHVDHCLETASNLDTLADKEATGVSAESLLARIRQDFGGKRKRGLIVLTKSELTEKYAPHPNRPNACKPTDLYDRYLPVLMDKGLARLVGKAGKKVSYEFAAENV